MDEMQRGLEPRGIRKMLDSLFVDEVFGCWKQGQKIHFDEGGIFDHIYQPSREFVRIEMEL